MYLQNMLYLIFKRIRLVDKVLILYLMEYDITNIQKNSDPRQDNDIM